ncbi:hypothetical protein [Streptomyces sp. cmx-4-25]|uniref:hypothetical protein n=1 Tax=unclassified Streptomyces TaxID=2593676 RepID=UPI00398152BD
MSPAPEPSAAPAAPAGRRARPDGHRRLVVLLLVLAALLGTGAAALLPGAAQPRAAAAAPASDPGGETHDQAATEAALPARTRRRRARPRPAGPRRGPHGRRDRRRNPVPAPRGDPLRCVVMRC